MGKFLVIGTGPLLDEPGTTFMSGQCLRTMHFVRPMKDAGHDVDLATVPISATPDDKPNSGAVSRKYQDLLRYKSFTTQDENALVRMIARVMEEKLYDGVVGINAYPSYLLARANPWIPFWADLNGWTMAEGQTRAALVGHDREMDHFWRLEVETILAADRISTVSERQADALYGELSLIGRLNRHTFDWPFAAAVPNAVYPLYEKLERGGTLPDSLAAKIPSDAPIVLWSGGFNTWTDVGLLADGLALALEANSSLHFVATGGSIKGHDDHTFARFQKLAAEKLPADRTHILGWVDTDLVVALHSRAQLGINIDSQNTETRFGARNRLTNMMGAGLPVLTTRGTEIADWIERHDLGAVVPLANPAAFSSAILDCAANREAWEKRARKARKRACSDFAPRATLTEFLRWCDDPKMAPDREAGLTRRGRMGETGHKEEFEARIWARLKLDRQVQALLTDRESLHRLRGRWPLTWYFRLRSWLNASQGRKT